MVENSPDSTIVGVRIFITRDSKIPLILCCYHKKLDILRQIVGVCVWGLISEETVVLRRWGSDTRKFGSSTELIM